MNRKVVTKGGGTSNSTAFCVRTLNEQAIALDTSILVASAPGVLSAAQFAAFPGKSDLPEEFLRDKITDQLLKGRVIYKKNGFIPKHVTACITARYQEIVTGLDIVSLGGEWMDTITPRVQLAISLGDDAASMLGERLQAEIYQALGWIILDPSRAPLPLLPREREAWKKWLQPIIDSQKDTRFILLGNTWFDGKNSHTFDRGGCDISGALAAYGINASVYMNMTDTPAQSVSPKIINDKKRRFTIDHLTYEEARDLGRNGTGLLHPEAIVPLMGAAIPTLICNTFNPTGVRTRYSDKVDTKARTGKVMAISLMSEVALVTVKEPGMSYSKGRVATFSTRLAEAGINLIDVEGHGSDKEVFIVLAKDGKRAQKLLNEATSNQGVVELLTCALITLVGYELYRSALLIRTTLTREKIGEKFVETHWFEGEHSLRFTAKSEKSAEIVNQVHASLVEQSIA
jgi:amino acid kinase family protein